MALVKQLLADNSLLKSANSEINNIKEVQDLRGHLGLSIVGNECLRYLQFNHYDCFTKEISNRLARLFNEGHAKEPVLTKELKDFLGIVVTNDQAEVVGFAGHWKGHIDGEGVFNEESAFAALIEGLFLVEFKTHNDKSFKEVKLKCVRLAKPVHYDQMQSYMGHRNLKNALYVAYNKNDSEIYLEIVEFDAQRFDELKRTEAEVILADTLLPRIGNDNPTWFKCKMCDAADVCFGEVPPKKSCKNCEHVDILDGGVWQCTKEGRSIKKFAPCDDYQLVAMLCIN